MFHTSHCRQPTLTTPQCKMAVVPVSGQQPLEFTSHARRVRVRTERVEVTGDCCWEIYSR